jgi:hypothetical protein
MAKLNIVVPTCSLFIGLILGLVIYHVFILKKEGFDNYRRMVMVRNNNSRNTPDMSAYVLKSTIPPCPPQPDLSKYMLKTECPSVPDLSQYVLKSSIPRPQPVILDCSKCTKPSGMCPPCPRPRCPEVKCPPPTVCPPPAPCPRQLCPPTVVKCKSEEAPIQQVRPYLAPLSVTGFGLG